MEGENLGAENLGEKSGKLWNFFWRNCIYCM